MQTNCSMCGEKIADGVLDYRDPRVAEHVKICKGPAEEGRKADAGKPRMDLLPPLALLEVGKVLEFGARKYAPDNWRKVEGWRWRYAGAALRHIFAWMAGEVKDAESGIHHIAHAACCILFLLEKDITHE